MKAMQHFKKWLGLEPWEVRRTIWPYKEGYGTYNPSKRMVLDTGLSREEAQRRCDQLNEQEHEKKQNDDSATSV